MTNQWMLLIISLALQHAAASSHAEDPSQILVSPDDILVYKGQTVLAPCVAYVHGDSSTQSSLTWLRNGSPLSSNTRLTTGPPAMSSTGDLLFVRSVLEVCDSQLEDSAVYSCVLTVDGVERDLEMFEIIVTAYDAPAQILASSADVEASSNQTLLLTCIAVALPSPTVSWSRNDHPIATTSSPDSSTLIASEEIVKGGVRMVRSTLSMCNLPRFANGVYSCVAANGITSSNSSFVVTREADIKLLSSSPDYNFIEPGNNVSFTCDFHSSPLPEVSWTGVPLSNGGRFSVSQAVIRENGVDFVRSVLSISPVADYDRGTISCVARNNIHELAHSFELNVYVPPRVIISPSDTSTAITSTSHTVSLGCVAHNAMDIVWLRGGQVITTDARLTVTSTLITREGREFVTSVLTICGAGALDSGDYSCRASLYSDYHQADFGLCFIDSTGFAVAPSDVTAVQSSSLSLTCVGYSTLPTSLSWRNTGLPVGNSTGVTVIEHSEQRGGLYVIKGLLIIDCLDSTQASHYDCNLVNEEFDKITEFHISVGVIPSISRESSDQGSSVGDTVSFECRATGDPLPSFLWFKDNSTIPLDHGDRYSIGQLIVAVEGSSEAAVESVLTIVDVVGSDAGHYYCQASSAVGTTVLGEPYLLLVDIPTIVDVGPLRTGIGHAHYIGNIICLLCFIAVMIVHLVIRALRENHSTPALLNMCLAMVALNLSFVISYNTVETGAGCVLFAALFHYFFLASLLSLTVLVVFKGNWFENETLEAKKRVLAYFIAFSINWGAPFLVVVLSLSPDVPHYTQPQSGHFCGPIGNAFWFGVVMLSGLSLPLTWIIFIALSYKDRSVLTDKPNSKDRPSICTGFRKEWYLSTLSTTIVLALFIIVWAIGLASTQTTDTVLQVFFLILSILFGAVVVTFYCFVLVKQPRNGIINTWKRVSLSSGGGTLPRQSAVPTASPSHDPTQPPDDDGAAKRVSAVNPRSSESESDSVFSDLSLSGIEAAKVVQEIPLEQRESRIPITSFTGSITEESVFLEKPVNNTGSLLSVPYPQRGIATSSSTVSTSIMEEDSTGNAYSIGPDRRGSVNTRVVPVMVHYALV